MKKLNENVCENDEERQLSEGARVLLLIYPQLTKKKCSVVRIKILEISIFENFRILEYSIKFFRFFSKFQNVPLTSLEHLKNILESLRKFDGNP